MHLKRDITGWLVTGLHSWETRNHFTSSAWNTYKTGRIGTKVSGRDSEEKKKREKTSLSLYSQSNGFITRALEAAKNEWREDCWTQMQPVSEEKILIHLIVSFVFYNVVNDTKRTFLRNQTT